jgi:hypothetical protein
VCVCALRGRVVEHAMHQHPLVEVEVVVVVAAVSLKGQELLWQREESDGGAEELEWGAAFNLPLFAGIILCGGYRK